MRNLIVAILFIFSSCSNSPTNTSDLCEGIVEREEDNIAFKFKEYSSPNQFGYFFLKNVVDDGTSNTFIFLTIKNEEPSTKKGAAVYFQELEAESIIKADQNIFHNFNKKTGMYIHSAIISLSPKEIKTLCDHTVSRYSIGDSGIILSNVGDDYRNYLKCLVSK